MLPSGSNMPAVHRAYPCCSVALQGEGFCWETLRLVCMWTQSKTGEDCLTAHSLQSVYFSCGWGSVPWKLKTSEVRMKLLYVHMSFFFSLSVTALTRAKLQASHLCALPPKRAKRSCCVHARKPKTHHTATARTLKSSSRIWRNQWKAFLNHKFIGLGQWSTIKHVSMLTDICSTYWFVPLLWVSCPIILS